MGTSLERRRNRSQARPDGRTGQGHARDGVEVRLLLLAVRMVQSALESRPARYVAEHMVPQFKDVVTRYQPAIIFSDGEWDMSSAEWKSEELLAWLFNESSCREEVVVNDRWGKDCRHKHGGYWTTEYAAG